MTGPEHYAEAERLTGLGHDMADQGHQKRANFILARAQVHATSTGRVDPEKRALFFRMYGR